MKTVEVYNMLWFHCPRCEHANFIREVFVNRGDTLVLEAVRECVCELCKYALTEREATGVVIDGGALLSAWGFTCDECGIDNVETRTIYRDSRVPSLKWCSESPPTTSMCRSCGAEFRLHLPDVEEGTHGSRD
jgi:hypothetical protein